MLAEVERRHILSVCEQLGLINIADEIDGAPVGLVFWGESLSLSYTPSRGIPG